jgi:hypothetical protein
VARDGVLPCPGCPTDAWIDFADIAASPRVRPSGPNCRLRPMAEAGDAGNGSSPYDPASQGRRAEADSSACCGAGFRELDKPAEVAASFGAGRESGSAFPNKPSRSRGNSDGAAAPVWSLPLRGVSLPDPDGGVGSCSGKPSRRDARRGSAITERSIADRSPNQARSFSTGYAAAVRQDIATASACGKKTSPDNTVRNPLIGGSAHFKIFTSFTALGPRRAICMLLWTP